MSYDWIEKRKSLKTLSAHSQTSSNLKKKQSIINKLKNLSTENFEILKNELENENFNKFHTEIINNLLFRISSATNSDIHKITEIFYLFYFDTSFMNYLIATLKKEYVKNKRWQLGCLIVEVWILNSKRKDSSNKESSINQVVLSILKGLETEKIPFMLYCCEYLEIDKSIFEDEIKKEMKTVSSKNIEMVNKVIDIVGLEEKASVFDDYQEIIKPIEGEFDFYNTDTVNSSINNISNVNIISMSNVNISSGNSVNISNVNSSNSSSGNVNLNNTNINTTSNTSININSNVKGQATSIFNKSQQIDIRNIEKRDLSPHLLDAIGYSIIDSPDLIRKLIKKKRYANFIPSLARILSKAIKNRKIYTESILSKTEETEDLLLICECYKFGIFSDDEIFTTIERISKTDLLCSVLYNVGRFLLYKKDTNRRAIETIERMKSTIKEDVARIQFNNCISGILNPVCCKIDIIDFLRGYFRHIKNNINSGYTVNNDDSKGTDVEIMNTVDNKRMNTVMGENIIDHTTTNTNCLMKMMKNSKRFIFMVLSQPSLFPNKEDLVYFVNSLDIEISAINSFYLRCIKKIYKKHKNLSMELINSLITINNASNKNNCEEDNKRQMEIIDSVLNIDRNDRWIFTAFIRLLDGFNKELHQKYLQTIKERCKSFNEYFNFCEKHGYKVEIEEDSFEREMDQMEEYSD